MTHDRRNPRMRRMVWGDSSGSSVVVVGSGVGGSGAAAGVGAWEAASADGNTVGAGAVGSTGGVLLGADTGCAGAGTG